jgi:hypothetical protein
MVSFLLDNSLGAWWAAKCDGGKGRRGERGKGIFKTAQSEEEIRNACALPGVPLEYLRFVRDKDGVWLPASGSFDAWPESLSELKIFDPCCGSGHFLVAAFLMLVPMRMELEGLSAKDAVDAVLRDNLYGLDIDKRVVEIAAFALALTAWRYPGAGGYRQLPELNLACSGLSVSVAREEWEKLANGNSKLRNALRLLHEEFGNAPLLGSLLNPDKSIATNLVDWKDLISALQSALEKERTDEEYEAGVVAYGLAKAATLLTGKYHLVITNVPYLTRAKQSQTLRDYCEEQYNEAKNDLATVFLDRCLDFCVQGGVSCIVLPQNWLFLTSYKKFREKLLKSDTWRLIARLGEGGFESSAAAGAFTILLIISRGNNIKGNFLLSNFSLNILTPNEYKINNNINTPRTPPWSNIVGQATWPSPYLLVIFERPFPTIGESCHCFNTIGALSSTLFKVPFALVSPSNIANTVSNLLNDNFSCVIKFVVKPSSKIISRPGTIAFNSSFD